MKITKLYIQVIFNLTVSIKFFIIDDAYYHIIIQERHNVNKMKYYIIIAVIAFSLSNLFVVTESYSYEDRIIPKEEYERLGPFPCPGLYCGRTLINDSYYTNCGKCDRGWRVGNNTHSICEECLGTPNKNDWFFLAFHVIFVLVLHWVAIDFSARRRSFTKEVLLLHTCAFFEVSVAAVITGILSLLRH